MTFRQLEYLEALAQESSISRASEKLFISQSALSQQIISMEREYQVQILDRSKSPLEFTENGRLILAAAREMLKIKRKLENELKNRQLNRLCIKTVPFYVANLVPYLCSKLYNQYPDVKVELKVDWAPTLFRSSGYEEVDLYLHAFDMDPPEPQIPLGGSMQHEVLFEEEILVTMSSKHPLLKTLKVDYDANGWPCISLRDLQDFAFILQSTSLRLLEIARSILGP
ncbi:MAG: LysR family transcriptional regulator [Oscillospiraceae bacterium]|nr:LysR family transcriptional regulator [Oscillospiraceae bacterium]